MSLARRLERQLGRPSRITARLLNLVNARVNRRAVELLEVSSEHRVLDVGFGGGVALRLVAERAAFAAGIDHSAAAARAAGELFEGEIARGEVRIEEAGVDSMPFDDASFDRVLGVHTIYFWPDPERGLREIVRVLKPGGRLLLATDAKAAPKAIARHGFTSYTEAQQSELLRRAGFSVIAVTRRGPNLFVLAENG